MSDQTHERSHEHFHEPTGEQPADSGSGRTRDQGRVHECGRDRPRSRGHGHSHGHDRDSDRERERGQDHVHARDRDAADLSSPAARRAAHRRLACALAACPHAMGVQYSAPGEAAAQPYAETEVLASVTLRGTVHPSVGAIVADSALELATVHDGNHPDYKQVVVR